METNNILLQYYFELFAENYNHILNNILSDLDEYDLTNFIKTTKETQIMLYASYKDIDKIKDRINMLTSFNKIKIGFYGELKRYPVIRNYCSWNLSEHYDLFQNRKKTIYLYMLDYKNIFDVILGKYYIVYSVPRYGDWDDCIHKYKIIEIKRESGKKCYGAVYIHDDWSKLKKYLKKISISENNPILLVDKSIVV